MKSSNGRQRRNGSAPKRTPYFETKLGRAYLGDSCEIMRELPEASVNLVLTSPPYALHFKKEYGNVSQREYVGWFVNFAREIHRLLADDGSFVLNIGGAWTPGQPTRSLYQYRLLIALCDEIGFHLAQEFYWYNPAKLPAPAEWVNVRKIRVKDSVEHVWWLSKSPWPKADNRAVLVPYSADMERLIKRGYRAKQRPSGHNITTKFNVDRGGATPPNLLTMGNNDANGYYMARCAEEGIKPHPARFPALLPEFFLNLLTDPSDLILDPFAGSNTTGRVAESMGRRWIACELEEAYLRASTFRFESESDLSPKERRDSVERRKAALPLF